MSFFLTFAIVRGMVFCIRHQIPPFHYMIMADATFTTWFREF